MDDKAAARNFVLLAQASLAGDFPLVERAQLDQAEQELKISLANRGTGSGYLRVGKWAKADIVVRGEFVDEAPQRKLFLQAINTATAEVLADRFLNLNLRANEPLKRAIGKVEIAAGVIKEVQIGRAHV